MKVLWSWVLAGTLAVGVIAVAQVREARTVKPVVAVAGALANDRCSTDASGVETCRDNVERYRFGSPVRSISWRIDELYPGVEPSLACWSVSSVPRECGIPYGTPWTPWFGVPWTITTAMGCGALDDAAACGFVMCEVTNGVVEFQTHPVN